MADNNTSGRGFAGMPKSKVEDIARQGGLATRGKNLTPEARRRGGKNSHGSRRSNSSS